MSIASLTQQHQCQPQSQPLQQSNSYLLTRRPNGTSGYNKASTKKQIKHKNGTNTQKRKRKEKKQKQYGRQKKKYKRGAGTKTINPEKQRQVLSKRVIIIIL